MKGLKFKNKFTILNFKIGENDLWVKKIINKENTILNDYNEGEKENITTFAAESLNAFSTKKEKK